MWQAWLRLRHELVQWADVSFSRRVTVRRAIEMLKDRLEGSRYLRELEDLTRDFCVLTDEWLFYSLTLSDRMWCTQGRRVRFYGKRFSFRYVHLVPIQNLTGVKLWRAGQHDVLHCGFHDLDRRDDWLEVEVNRADVIHHARALRRAFA